MASRRVGYQGREWSSRVECDLESAINYEFRGMPEQEFAQEARVQLEGIAMNKRPFRAMRVKDVEMEKVTWNRQSGKQETRKST